MMTSRWSSSLRLVVLLLSVLLAAPPALAKPPKAFKQHLQKALKLYDAGEYEDAIKEFQAAYALRQMPKLLLNIAQTHRKLGRAKEALDFYEFYLRVEPNPKPELKAELEAYIKQTKAMLAVAEEMKRKRESEDQAAQEEAKAMVEGTKAETEKEKAEKEAAAKAEQERLAQEKAQKEAELQRALAVQAQKEAADLSVRKAAPERRQPIYKKWWFWTAIGGGAVIVTAAVVGGVLGSQSSPAPPDPMLPAGVDVRDTRFP